MKTRKRRRKSSLDEIPIPINIIEADTQCLACEAEFLDEEDLKMHIEQVHSKGIVVCKFCSAKLSGLDEYTTHFINSHLEMALICYYCHRTFLDKTSLEMHESKHCAVQDELLSCSQCVQMFASRYELQKHEYEEHSDTNEGVLLNNMYSLLSSTLNMQVTKFLDVLAKNKPVSCLICNHYSTSIIDYIDHLNTSNCKSFTCDKCWRVYKNKIGVIKHVLNHPQCQNVSTEVTKACYKCKKVFNKHEINVHIQSCNAKKCKTCGVICMSIYDLAEHKIKEHKVSQAVTLVACSYCKREFVGDNCLKKHLDRVHQNQHLYKYSCTYCKSLFKHPKNLFAHFFSKHKDIYPYTCKICDKKFRIRKKFTIHIKLDHKSIGFVEFDENLHVIFTDKKSENPILPAAPEGFGCSTDKSTDAETSKTEVIENIDERSKNTGQAEPIDTTIEITETKKNLELNSLDTSRDASEKTDLDNNDSEKKHIINKQSEVKIKKYHKRTTRKRGVLQRSPPRTKETKKVNTDSDFSEDEPLIKIKKKTNNKNMASVLPQKQTRKSFRNQTAKLTCNKCNKYCYTFQNYHHHMSLHAKNKMKKCIKCLQYFKSRDELNNHINKAHSSSKLTETLKSLLEKRKKNQTVKENSNLRPAETLKSVLEQRKKAQLMSLHNSTNSRFRKTIKKVDVTDKTTVTITSMTDHGLSVKKYIENFRPDNIDNVSISSSVTFKALTTPVEKAPMIKLSRFREEPTVNIGKLRFPQKFKDEDESTENVSNVRVKLIQELLTKPRPLNFIFDERLPTVRSPTPDEYSDYCNTFADETDYTQYKNDTIPEVAHEIMLGEADDIPKTRQLAQEIFIPNIPEGHGEVRIGHLMPKAPFFKIVKVNKLLKPPPSEKDAKEEEEDKNKGIELPDGTQLVTVKNPFSHLIPNDDLQKIVKANTNKYYTPKVKNIQRALITALQNLEKPRAKSQESKRKKKGKNLKSETDSIYSFETVDTNESFENIEMNQSVESPQLNELPD